MHKFTTYKNKVNSHYILMKNLGPFVNVQWHSARYICYYSLSVFNKPEKSDNHKQDFMKHKQVRMEFIDKKMSLRW